MKKYVLHIMGETVNIRNSHIQILIDPTFIVDDKALAEDIRKMIERRYKIPVKLKK